MLLEIGRLDIVRLVMGCALGLVVASPTFATNEKLAVAYVAQVAAGSSNTCRLTSTGGVKSRGSNDVGQLGTASMSSNKLTPVDVMAYPNELLQWLD